MALTRRDLFRNAALSGLALSAGSTFAGFPFGGTASAGPTGYGPLVPDPAGILDLPKGFEYRILAKGGDGYPTDFTRYDDGQKFAGDADAAASYTTARNRTVLVMNHELSNSEGELAERVPMTFAGKPLPTYDPAAGGGTSNLVIKPNGDVESIYPSLAGTINNCAGGYTPWGTWLTCEETEATIGGIPHGYVFEVDPEGKLTTAVPYKPMGRFAHEAVSIDPATSFAYLTEDNTNGLVYKFEPADTSQTFGSLGNGGELFAMKAEGIGRLGEVKVVGTTVDIRWNRLSNPDTTGLRNQLGSDNTNVTRSQKLEGTWFANGIFYFVSSYERMAGIAHHGQVWALDPANDTITLVAYIPVDHPVFDSPDNITVTPWGQLLLCEDGDDTQYLVGVEPGNGDLWAFARNAMPSSNEFAGANFSPDGKTLFVNVQNPSTTFAITGPWGAQRKGQTSFS